jgi:hypothetical protein
MEALLVAGMFIAIFSGVVAYAAAFALRPEIAAAEPGYASRLFRGLADQVMFRQLPVRVVLLLREQPPGAVRSSVQVLRWAFGIFCGAVAATFGLALLMVFGVAA